MQVVAVECQSTQALAAVRLCLSAGAWTSLPEDRDLSFPIQHRTHQTALAPAPLPVIPNNALISSNLASRLSFLLSLPVFSNALATRSSFFFSTSSAGRGSHINTMLAGPVAPCRSRPAPFSGAGKKRALGFCHDDAERTDV